MATTAGYEALRSKAVILPDLDLAVIELTGEDRLDWLQGQATNDLRGLKPGDSKSFCLCEATGQIVAVCDLWVEQDRLLIVTDRAPAPHVLKRAETMVILEDVVARDLTPDFRMLSVQGPEADLHKPDVRGGVILLNSPRLSSSGWDLWVPSHLMLPLADLPILRTSDYEIARLEAGIPKFGVDYTAKTLPPELGPSFESKHVSYNKGCYMGQEVLMRIHSRGHTNKTWVGLILEGPVQPGAKVSHSGREDAGVVTSVAISPALGPLAGATLRNEAARDGELVTVGSVRAEVKTFPLK